MKKKREPAQRAAGGKKNEIRIRLKQSRQLYIIFALPLIYFLVFRYGAMGWLTLAFKDYNAVEGLWGSEWVGLKHFIDFFKMPDFWKLLRNTLLISLYSLIFSFPVPILLALMINEVGNKFFKKDGAEHYLSAALFCDRYHLRHAGGFSDDGRHDQPDHHGIWGRADLLFDRSEMVSDNLYRVRHLAGRRLGVDHVSGGVKQCGYAAL